MEPGETQVGTIRYQDDFLAFWGASGPTPAVRIGARTKGKVGNLFYYLQEHFLGGLAMEELSDLDLGLAAFMEQYNARPHRQMRPTLQRPRLAEGVFVFSRGKRSASVHRGLILH